MKLFAVRDIVVYALAAGAFAALMLSAWSWARRRGRFLIAGASTAVGFLAWNLTLNATHAAQFNTDAPVGGLSWADAGSGVLAFAVSALVLGLVAERHEHAYRAVGAAAIAGLMAAILDIFVL
jgi:hypothetical protein